MNTFVLFAALLVAVAAAPQQKLNYRIIPVLSRFETRDAAGQFSLQYQTGDGTVFTEQGALKRTPDGTDNVLVKQGSYRFISPEGVPVQVSYTADENGFHPVSDSIPVPPVALQPTF